MAKTHYIDYGYFQGNRTINVPQWDIPSMCSSNDRSRVECVCNGTLHYGQYYRLDTAD